MPHQVFFTLGKGEYVRWVKPDGTIQEVCECKWNAELSVKGCPAQVHGKYMAEVMANNGRYTIGTIPDKRKGHGVDHRCDYCYSWTNWGEVTPRVVGTRTENEFKEKKPKDIRLGKVTDAGHPLYVHTLMDFAELSSQRGSGIILPSKMLVYGRASGEKLSFPMPANMPSGRDLASRLEKAGGVLHISLGINRLEVGAVSQGFTNDFRLEQGRLFRQAGCNVTYTIVCDVTQSLAANEAKGFHVVKALEAGRKYGIPVRFIPLRIKSNKLALDITGEPMKYLIGEDGHPRLIGIDNGKRGTWQRRGNNEIEARVLHPDFQALVKQGIGLCGVVGENEYCDKCHLCPSSPERITFPASQRPVIVYDRKLDDDRRKGWRNREKIKRLKKLEKIQGKLNLD